MVKRILLPLLIITLWEVGVFLFSVEVSSLETVHYQLAARYSARASFVIVAALLLWMGIYGLKRIYKNENTRNAFLILVLAFAFNHFIHFIFIILNYRSNGLNLWEGKNLPGALGYIMLLVAPAYLWQKKVLNQSLRLQIHLFLLLIVIIFFVTYLGRLSNPLPLLSPSWVYEICLVIMGLLVILNSYRYLKENH